MTKEEHNKIVDFVNSDDYMLLNSYISKPYEETIIEQDKEIERLKKGYCELKEKCNNGECDCTREEYDGMVQGNMKLSLENDRLNNIIDELEKYIILHFKEDYCLDNEETYFILNKIKELKEGNSNE